VLGEREQAECGEREADRCTAESETLTPLSLRARALYEGGVVPVREVARLCRVSVPGLYYHIRKQGWRRRRPSTPRDPKKAERQRQRRAAAKAALPPRPRGLKARDPQGEAVAVALCERASELSQAAQSRALARRDAEADVRVLSILARALRELAGVRGAPKARRAVRPREPAGDIDKMRRELAQRIDDRVRERAAVAASALPVPPVDDVAPVEDEAPLSEADRRINAVAARFYATRGGDG
jgi:AcrR family transcriptional regulator